MATGVRLRRNFLDGALNGAITDTATSADSPDFANLPVVASPDYLALTIDNEIVHVTDHTSGATTVTIERGQESTAAASHADAAVWEHAPTVKDYDEAYEDLQVIDTSGTATTLDVGTASAFKVTLTDNCTFTFTGAVADEVFSFVVWLFQDATGGWVPTWPTEVAWPNAGETPVLTTTAGTISALTFTTLDGGTTWLGNLVGDDYQ